MYYLSLMDDPEYRACTEEIIEEINAEKPCCLDPDVREEAQDLDW